MKTNIMIQNIDLGYGSGDCVLSGVTAELHGGRIYGLLGLNGSGKTTLLKAISGLIKPKRGDISVMGFIPFQKEKEFLRQLMSVTIHPELPDMTAKRFAKTFSTFWPDFSINEFNALMQKFQIDTNRRLPSMSTGERKKCLIAFAMATNTPILLLDEPMAGLDIVSTKTLIEAIVMSQKPDRIIIISSNQVEEFDNIYTDILLLHEGSLLTKASIDELTSKFAFHNQGMHPNTIFEDGLKSISLNLNDECTDINLKTLFYAACTNENVREILTTSYRNDNETATDILS